MRHYLPYLALWTVVCSLSAAPSFWLAYGGGFHVSGMLLGITIFIAAYTIANASPLYNRIKERKPLLHRALCFGFGLRMLLSVTALILFLLQSGTLTALGIDVIIYLDLYSGALAISLVELVSSSTDKHGFLFTLFTTLTEGTILSLAILLVSLATWGVLALCMKYKPPQDSSMSL